jgi:hypothetical protein
MTTSIVYPDRPSGYSQNDLAKAFDRVRVSRDWKGPIRAEILATEQGVVQAALLWFGSTMPTFTAVPDRPDRLVVTTSGSRLVSSGWALTDASK